MTAGGEKIKALIPYILAFVIPVAATGLGSWGFLVDILVIVSLVWLGLKEGIVRSIFTAGLGFIVVYLISQSLFLSLSKAFLALGISSLYIIGIQHSWKPRKILFWAAVTGGCYGLLGLLTLGHNPIATIQANLTNNIGTIIDYYRQSGALQVLKNQGISESDIRDTLGQAFQFGARLFPSLLIMNGIMIAVFSFLLLKLTKIAPGMPVAPFRYWNLPWYAIWGGIASIAAYLAGDYFHVSWLVTAGINIGAVYFLVCLLLGSAIAAYFLGSGKIPLMFILLFAFLAFFDFFLTSCILALCGLFDLVLNFRRIPESA